MKISFSDSDIKKVEKQLHKKCTFIDWRYDNYYFGEGEKQEVLGTEDILEILCPNGAFSGGGVK